MVCSNHPQCLRFSIGCMLRSFLRARRAPCICRFPGTDLEDQREAQPVKENSWEEGTGKWTRKIFVSWGRILMLSGERMEGLSGNWWGWEKGKKTWQSVKAEIGMEKMRSHWLHPCCLVMFRNCTIRFISWNTFLKQATFSLLWVFTPSYMKFLKQTWLRFEITRKQEIVVLTEILLGVFLYSNHNHLYWQVQKTRSFSCNKTDYQRRKQDISRAALQQKHGSLDDMKSLHLMYYC